MTLLRCPKFLRCLAADTGNFDRGHSLTSLLLPLAALSSLPTSARSRACTNFPVIRRGGRLCPPAGFVLYIRQGTRALPYKTVVGRDPCVPPPTTLRGSCNLSLRSRCAHRLWQSASPSRAPAFHFPLISYFLLIFSGSSPSASSSPCRTGRMGRAMQKYRHSSAT